MSIFTPAERNLLEAVSDIAFGNPFLPSLSENEKRALGGQYVEEPPFWSLEVDDPAKRRVNAWRIVDRIETLAASVRDRLARGRPGNARDLQLYEDAAVYSLYHRFYERLVKLSERAEYSPAPVKIDFYREFLSEFERQLRVPGTSPGFEPLHLFACFYQIVRAFQNVFVSIIGASSPAGRLRASVWQSIFTHDMRRYRRTFYSRMTDFATLITGPSGSGKELVARAVALSGYLPFDPHSQSFGEAEGLLHPVHIAALTSSLIESELFGHRKGSFTGALHDRRGWFDTCPPFGAVFLDEIGELPAEIQVKLLRVIETRTFSPVGDTRPRRFDGKLIAATNRDLRKMISRGEFREDLYYRLCSDLIETPSLSDQLRDRPTVLRDMVRFVARRNAGPEAESLGDEACDWIERNLGMDYEWPGNYRELEQCVRNLIIRREYRPVRSNRDEGKADPFAGALAGNITAEELLRRYCTLVYAKTGSYQETARCLQIDRRTVKSRIDPLWLAKLQTE